MSSVVSGFSRTIVLQVLDQEALFGGCFAQPIVAGDQRERGRTALGCDERRGQLQRVGGAQRMHAQETPRGLADLVLGSTAHLVRTVERESDPAASAATSASAKLAIRGRDYRVHHQTKTRIAV